MKSSQGRRALGGLVFFASRSEPASTDSYSCSLAAERRGDCVRASWVSSQSNASFATRTSVCTYLVPLLLYQGLLRFLLDERPMPFFDLRIRWAESSDFGPKSVGFCRILDQNLTTWAIGFLKSDFCPVGFLQSRTASAGPSFFSDRKIKIRRSESDRVRTSVRSRNGSPPRKGCVVNGKND